MTTQTIDSDDLTVADLLKSFYVVPDYQREYVWGTDQVEQLLTDIIDEMSGQVGDQVPEYFIGSIVVCPGKNGVLDLIDGQQRMTTLYLTLCAIRDRLRALGAQESSVLKSQLADASVDASGEETHRYRLDLQYEDSGDALTQIADGKIVISATTGSVRAKSLEAGRGHCQRKLS